MSDILVKVIRNIAGAEAIFEGHFIDVAAALVAAHEFAGADKPAVQANTGKGETKPAAAKTEAKPEAKAEVKKQTAATAPAQSGATQPTTEKAAAASAPAGAAEADGLEYVRDIRPLVVKVSTEKGRETITALLQRYGVAKGPDLTPEQWADFKNDAERTLSGEWDPVDADAEAMA